MSVFVCVVLFLLLCILAFYSLPFVRTNQTILYTNKHIQSENDSCLLEKPLEYLRIIPHCINSEDTKISITTNCAITIKTWNELVVCYHIKATVKDWDTWKHIAVYYGKRTLNFSFKGRRWIVTEHKG